MNTPACRRARTTVDRHLPKRRRQRQANRVARRRRRAGGRRPARSCCRPSPAAHAIQDLFFVFYMLALAQYWNLLAGYAGLVSVGQQAFVGLGGYLLFALTILAGIDPLLAILLAGAVAGAAARCRPRFVVFRLRGAYFAIGTWVVAEVFRLVLAQFKQLGGGTGTSLPPGRHQRDGRHRMDARRCSACAPPAARDIVTYWLALALAAGTILAVYLHPALAPRPGARRHPRFGGRRRERRRRQFPDQALGLCGDRGRHRHGRRADLSAEGAHLARRRLLGARLDRLRDLHRGDRRHRHDRGADHRRASCSTCCRPTSPHFGTWYLILLGALAIVVMLFAPQGHLGLLSERYDLVLFPIRRRLVEVKGSRQ